VRQVAEQIALLMDQERELRANIESGVRQHFLPLLAIAGVRPIVAAGLIGELHPLQACLDFRGSVMPHTSGAAGVAA
jgi:hypothetical protein